MVWTQDSRRRFPNWSSRGKEFFVEKKSQSQGLKGYFPVLSWLPNYKVGWLRFDIITALSVWAPLVLKDIAYASLSPQE
jgi:hypothetical protein